MEQFLQVQLSLIRILKMQNVFKSVGIIGYGKFSRLLIELFEKYAPGITVLVYSRSNPVDEKLFYSLESVASADLIIPSVPIRGFRDTLINIAKYLHEGQVVMDVCSVKEYPKETMLTVLPETVDIVCSHPMFGPASYKKLNGKLDSCHVVMENVRAAAEKYHALKEFFNACSLEVVEMTAAEHDKLAANFQFITLTTATALKKLNLSRSAIDTPSAGVMLDFLEMISVDSDLVHDLYTYNKYCKEQFLRLKAAFDEISGELLR